MSKQKIAIIGFGRFGKLIAEILSKDAEIFIISKSEINDKRFKQIDYSDLKSIDWVIPTVPIGVMPEILKKINPFLKNGILVMDVCSVKAEPCKWMKELLPDNVEILGSHPMFGPDSVKKGLSNLEIVFCPVRISEKKFREVKNIFSKMKLKIIKTTPEEHDRQSAISLALVHFIGRGLDGLRIEEQEISTLGFKRLLQLRENIANDSMELFRDMHHFNPYAKEVRDEYLRSLQKINLMLGLYD